MESELIVDREGPIAWITLNRPERLNAITVTMLDKLAKALTDLEHSDAKVVVIRGAGTSFSAGYDINPDADEVGEAHRRGPVADRNRQAAYIEYFTRIWRHPQPVIAMVHGYCMAGASQLACFCDITVVADEAIIAASPALPLGGGFISPLWSFRIGPQRAKELSFVPGRQIDGRTAVEWGYANSSVPEAELESTVRELAMSIATVPAPVLQMKKLAVNRVQEIQGFLTIASFGADTDALIHTTSDVSDIQQLVREVGIKEAIRRFSGS